MKYTSFVFRILCILLVSSEVAVGAREYGFGKTFSDTGSNNSKSSPFAQLNVNSMCSGEWKFIQPANNNDVGGICTNTPQGLMKFHISPLPSEKRPPEFRNIDLSGFKSAHACAGDVACGNRFEFGTAIDGGANCLIAQDEYFHWVLPGSPSNISLNKMYCYEKVITGDRSAKYTNVEEVVPKSHPYAILLAGFGLILISARRGEKEFN
jgi:hypothetical protein